MMMSATKYKDEVNHILNINQFDLQKMTIVDEKYYFQGSTVKWKRKIYNIKFKISIDVNFDFDVELFDDKKN